jgi:2-polyprenyl-3-methyl-5-hydroxy-6-metoxy-1,4-benzoquinol methylase
MNSCSPLNKLSADYDVSYYDAMLDGSRESARGVVPIILELFPDITSVVDFGCGPGAWLAEFVAAGVDRVLGIDSGVGVPDRLLIPPQDFRAADLTAATDGLARYDLALCLETVEHMPAESGQRLVELLCRSAPRILFSAAIPKQGGQDHLNEQWLSHWMALFAGRGYRPVDLLRPRIWRNERIDWWYRQNIILFLDPSIALEPGAATAAGDFAGSDLVHPDCFIGHVDDLRDHAGDLARQLAAAGTDIAELKAAGERAAAELADAKARSAALCLDRARLEDEARTEIERIRRMLRAAEERCEQTRNLLELRERDGLRVRQAEKRLRKTLSWRLTRPLRLLAGREERTVPPTAQSPSAESPLLGTSWADHLIERHVRGLTFADVGGLWGTNNEKVSVALRAGARHATMIDMQPLDGELWELFERRCRLLGVTGYDRLCGNLDDTAFVHRCGPFDFVHCSGVLYHVPNPRHSLRNLAQLCRRHLILVSMIVPEVIANDQGEVVNDGADGLYMLELDPQQRSVLGRHFDELGLQVANIQQSDELAWHEDGRVNYAPWWWLLTPRQVAGLLAQAGFEVLESGEVWQGRAHGFWCRRIDN